MNISTLGPHGSGDNRNGITTVTLSRRNIEGLLAQLDEAKKGDPAQIMRRTDHGLYIVVAEEDAARYNSPDREGDARGRAGHSGPGQRYDEKIPAT